jgi:RNA polymerase sigma-70 factor (ECF subfamily)
MPEAAVVADRFDRLLRETQGIIRARIAGMGVPTHAVDDVAQEVYLDFFAQGALTPDGVEPLRWLCGMARNQALEYFRRSARESTRLCRVSELLAEDLPDSYATDMEEDARLPALQKCLQQLDKRHRSVLEQHYRKGHTVDEMAQMDGKSTGAIHMVLARLREALKRCMATQRILS